MPRWRGALAVLFLLAVASSGTGGVTGDLPPRLAAAPLDQPPAADAIRFLSSINLWKATLPNLEAEFRRFEGRLSLFAPLKNIPSPRSNTGGTRGHGRRTFTATHPEPPDPYQEHDLPYGSKIPPIVAPWRRARLPHPVAAPTALPVP